MVNSPHTITFSIANASAKRIKAPILWLLVTLSNTTTREILGLDGYSYRVGLFFLRSCLVCCIFWGTVFSLVYLYIVCIFFLKGIFNALHARYLDNCCNVILPCNIHIGRSLFQAIPILSNLILAVVKTVVKKIVRR
jgi:hypothetical protein